jgi:RNA polymerase sigma-70 factor (ECF subfamily)
MEVPATQPTLLERLRDPRDEAAWRQFEGRYAELILRFARRQGVQAADADDVVQCVLSSLLSAFPKFEYDPTKGRFRDYLFRCTRNAILRQKRGNARPREASNALDDLQPPAPETTALWEEEWISHHYRIAFATIRATFDPTSVRAFEEVLRGTSVREVAEACGLSEQAVHKVKQRIRDRMRALVAAQIRDEEG